MEAVIEAVPMPQVADLHPAAGEGGEPNLRRMGPRDVFLAEPADPQLLMDAINPSLLKTIKERAVCSFDTLCLGIADACKWGAYAGVWGGMIATGMVSLMSLPSSLLGTLLGGAVGFGESVVEGGLHYAEHQRAPGDQCPLLLGNIPIENLPVVGDFISFRWMKHLPYQGENVSNSIFTFVGSRVSSGATVGFGLGLAAALVNINPSSILAAAAFTALAAFSIAVVINVVGVMLNTLIMTTFEMQENYLECKRLYDKPIRDRIIDIVSSAWRKEPMNLGHLHSPKRVVDAAALLGIPSFRVTDDAWHLRFTENMFQDAAITRLQAYATFFAGNVHTYQRFLGLILEALRVLTSELRFKKKQADRVQEGLDQQRAQELIQEQHDLAVLGIDINEEELRRDLITAQQEVALRLFNAQFQYIHRPHDINEAANRLLQGIEVV